MGNKNWTPEQQDAIRARGGTLLVSAAAGSGKTAVLVERVMQRLTDPVSPTSADRLLVVTFTKAAAAEMRERISRRLEQLLEVSPQDRHLQRQYLLLPRAQISTVHSFCSELVRENFYKLGISPDFRVMEESEIALLRQQAILDTLEEAYEQGGEVFLDLLEAFGADRDDRRLMQAIGQIYDFSRSHPFPSRWLKEKAALYEENRPVGETVWGKTILSYAAEAVFSAISFIHSAQEMLVQDGTLQEAYAPAFTSDLDGLLYVQDALKSGDWQAASAAIRGMEFVRLKAVRGYQGDAVKERAVGLRGEAKEIVKELSGLLSFSEEEFREDCARMAPVVRALFDLVERFSERLSQQKAQRKAADFGDLEHWALRLLWKETPEGMVRTEEARQLAAQFDEVMVDEYQDTNEAQDMLFRAVSQEERNLFFVGDVKQSIYSFRQAMPHIFLQRRKTFPAYSRQEDRYPAYLTLDRNFRSRKAVTDTVNFVFRQLMSEQAGGVAYEGEEELVPGAQYPPQDGCETRIDILESPEEGDEPAPEEGIPVWEARHIARMIHQMVGESFPIQEGGISRPVTYRDFCILLRSTNPYAAAYAKELQLCGIPAWTDASHGFFETAEIAGILSLLRVIDNPVQDIPLAAVLMGPVYGFTVDDIAKVRLEGKGIPLYLALSRHAEQGDARSRAVLEDLQAYRTLAATLPSDQLIEEIYQRSGYRHLVQAMDHGSSRLANLQLLLEYAAKWEQSGYAGLSRLLPFFDRLQEQKTDLPAANPLSDAANVVRIMSIHRSKGLEFPVCILAGCSRRFNRDRGEVLLHSRLGIGMKLRDPHALLRYTTLPREAVALELERESVSEELRVLYVAMTRAKEKLVIVTTVPGQKKNLDAWLEGLAAKLDSQPRIPAQVVAGAGCIADWLLLCALRHPSGRMLRERIGVSEDLALSGQTVLPWDIRVEAVSPPWDAEQLSEPSAPAPADPAMVEELERNLRFRYPLEALQHVPAKVTASELAAKYYQEKTGETYLSRPAFLHAAGLTAAERGTALHQFFQFMDYRTAREDPKSELTRLEGEGFLTAEQVRAVDLRRVQAFFASPLAQRMLASSCVLREYQFGVEAPIRLVRPDLQDNPQRIILQGAADCLFAEDDGWILVDYKTDYVQRPEDLWQRYQIQLALYAAAIRKCTGKPVRECFLYSFHLNQAVQGELSWDPETLLD